MRNLNYQKADLTAHIHLQMKINYKEGEKQTCDDMIITTSITNYTIDYMNKKFVKRKRVNISK